jgi:hypothetical protein
MSKRSMAVAEHQCNNRHPIPTKYSGVKQCQEPDTVVQPLFLGLFRRKYTYMNQRNSVQCSGVPQYSPRIPGNDSAGMFEVCLQLLFLDERLK